jgi:hypothetical protein
MMQKRLGMFLVVAATVPLIVGAGGMGPGQPGARKITGPALTATVVIDPHMGAVTSTAKRATIRLSKGTQESAATFDIGSFLLNRGCDVGLTDLRFVYVAGTRPSNLYAWVPFDVVQALLAPLGIVLDGSTVPVITDVNNVACTADPHNVGFPDSNPPTYGANCPVVGLCTNPNNQNIFTDGGDGAPALAGILSFTAVVQFEVSQNH